MTLLPSQRRPSAFCDPRFVRVFCTVVLAGVLLLALLLVGVLHLLLERGTVETAARIATDAPTRTPHRYDRCVATITLDDIEPMRCA